MANNAMARKSDDLPSSGIKKVAITLHGRDYVVACGAGEENHLSEIVRFVDERLTLLSQRNEGVPETRLFMLACLMLADELMETKRKAAELRQEDEDLYVAAVNHLQERVEYITQSLSHNNA